MIKEAAHFSHVYPVEGVHAPEYEPDSKFEWAGGFFEAGGHISLQTKPSFSKEFRLSYPIATVNESHTLYADRIYAELGGTTYWTGNTWRWKLTSSDDTVDFVQKISRFSPSLNQRILPSVLNWRETDDFDERVQIAQNLNGYNRFSDLHPEDYTDLFKSKIWLAGVVDNRLRPSNYKRNSNNFRINSRNKPVLDLLHAQYESNDVDAVCVGKNNTHFPSYELRFTRKGTKDLLDTVGKHLRVRRDLLELV